MVDEPSTGLVIVIAGASLSRRVTWTDCGRSVARAVGAGHVRSCSSRTTRATLMPLAGVQVGASPELSVAV